MTKSRSLSNGIPVSVSLNSALEAEDFHPQETKNKRRIFIISLIAVGVAIGVCFISKFLVLLINLITNISFHGIFSLKHGSPVDNSLGYFVIVIPVIGGLIVGLMALYGSKAIRGHGIPEAMEQVLTNQSKIKPAITYLKPLSSAIAIGTGGPFGAEGPIIATGGAMGSTFGQLLNISHNERKILLAAGATAGMSAIFGSPIAAIFLAIELLLFEFSPRSIIPVALACITGAAGHHYLFDQKMVFEIKPILGVPSNPALFLYSLIGILIGLLSVFVTKVVYFIEDGFEKLPIHWMWWPAIAGLAVGLIGYFNPHTMGVGYENITNVLSGSMPMQLIISLCLLKFISWAIALGSGTSGGTLAPLLTIGGACGVLLGNLVIYFFPQAGISLPMAGLMGMSAMFAGTSRALFTSVIFAMETTGQYNALLPLLATCTASYFISFFLMENTIMTEKIARRGVKTPHSYEPDILEKITVGQVIRNDDIVLSEENTIGEARDWLQSEPDFQKNYFIIVSNENEFRGIISLSNLRSSHHAVNDVIVSLIKRKNVSIGIHNSLRSAAALMAQHNVDVLPIISAENTVVGILTYKDILSGYKLAADEHKKKYPPISLKRQGLRMLIRGKKLIHVIKRK